MRSLTLPTSYRYVLIAISAAIAAVALSLSQAPDARAGMAVGLEQPNLTTLLPAAKVDENIAEMAAAGARVVRTPLRWSEVARACRNQTRAARRNHTNSCYDWSGVDPAVESAKKHGMLVIASVTRVPQWVHNNNDTFYVGSNKSQIKKFAAHYSDFMRAVAYRYRRRGGRPIKAITVWNEPNADYFWKPYKRSRFAATAYAYTYYQAAKAFKDVNRWTRIAPGPTGPKSPGTKPAAYIRYFQAFMRKRRNTRRLVDGWAHNPYDCSKSNPWPYSRDLPSICARNIRDIFRILDESGVTRNKRVWATEFAYEAAPAEPTGVSEAQQAKWMGTAMHKFERTGRIPVMIWYIYKDPQYNPANPDWQSGILRHDGTRRPSAAMYQRPVSETGGDWRARRGKVTELFGMANVDGSRNPTLAYSYDGRRWFQVPGQRRIGNAVRARIKPNRTMLVSVYADGAYGPSYRLRVR